MQVKAVVIGPVALAVGILVGGALGYTLAPQTPTAAPAAPAAAPASPAVREAPAATPGASPAAGPAAAPASSSPAPSSAASATGDGVITGRVLGPEGKPLEGVLVRATPEGDGEFEVPTSNLPAGSPPPREDVAQRVRDYEKLLLREEAGIREATTDASGAYSLPGLGAKSYGVHAWLVGWRISRTHMEPWASVSPGQVCDFTAVPLRALRLSVLLPDGSAPAEASITCKSADGNDTRTLAWKPGAASIDLDHGTWEITASANPPGKDAPSSVESWKYRRRFHAHGSESAAYSSDPQTVAIGEGEAPEVVLQLQGRPGILVRVAFASEERPRCVRIAALRMEAGKPSDATQLVREFRVTSKWLVGEAEGLLTGLEAGTYLVGVTYRGGTVGPTATAVVGNELATVDLRVPAGAPSDFVKLWVRGPDGKPVTDAEIEAGCRGPEGHGSADLDLRPEADGSYRVEHFEKDAPSMGSSWSFGGDELGAGARTYFVEVESSRLGKLEQTYDPAKDREITVSFAAPAILRATVAGWAENPERDRASLTLESKGESASGFSGDSWDGEISRSGVATFPPVRPGRFDLVLRMARNDSRRGRWNASEVSRTPLNLGSGETAVTVALVALHELVVTFEGDAPNLQSVGPDGVPRRSGSYRSDGGEGSVTFADLAPGRYRLSSEDGSMWVDVPSAGPVVFRPTGFNCFFVQVLEKGYLLDLGLRTGDLVVAIDGTEFKDSASMHAALQASKGRATSTFTIQRDGRRFDVTAEGRRFEEDDGSYYQPWTR